MICDQIALLSGSLFHLVNKFLSTFLDFDGVQAFLVPLDFFLLFDMLHLALKVILDFTVFLKLEHMLTVSFDLVLMHVIVDDLAPESILLLVLNSAKHADSATLRGSTARVIAMDRGEVLLASPPVWC